MQPKRLGSEAVREPGDDSDDGGIETDLVTITHFTAKRFEALPQVGVPVTRPWYRLARWLTAPTIGATKTGAGAWCPAALPGGAVKNGRGPMSLLVADVDDCAAGAIRRHAEILSDLRGLIIPTFSATPEKPKHRIVVRLSREITEHEFPVLWPKMSRDFATLGIVVDKGCKNNNRLYFACVAKSAEAWLGAAELRGDPIPVDVMLAAAEAERVEQEAARIRKSGGASRVPITPEGRDRYVAGACEKARANVASASEGGRHDVLLKETFALARFGLSEAEITRALLESFVATAGEHRRREGERAIRDAAAARGRVEK